MTHISRLAGGVGTRSLRLLRTGAIGLAAALLVSLPLTGVAYAAEVCGPDGRVPMKMIGEGGGDAPGQQPDLLIDKPCTIDAAKPYFYATVNIVNDGSLNFIEPAGSNSRIDFWASSIIVENKGALNAGESEPYGTRGGVLTIYIYGKDQSGGKNPAVQPGQGALCYTALWGVLSWAGMASAQMPHDAESMVRRRCAVEWPDSFRMQAYCLKSEAQGYRQLGSFYDNNVVPFDPADEARKARLRTMNGYHDPAAVELCPPPHKLTRDGCQ